MNTVGNPAAAMNGSRMATPAISDGLVIVRGLKHLFAFKAP